MEGFLIRHLSWFDTLTVLNKVKGQAHRKSVIRHDFYCPIQGMGEKPSPLGEDFSMIR
jgi:hypothetical protein